MRRLSDRVGSILDDLLTELQDGVEDTSESWHDIVCGAMSGAWDQLLHSEPTGSNGE